MTLRWGQGGFNGPGRDFKRCFKELKYRLTEYKTPHPVLSRAAAVVVVVSRWRRGSDTNSHKVNAEVTSCWRTKVAFGTLGVHRAKLD